MIKLFLISVVISCVFLQVNGQCDQMNEVWAKNICNSTCKNLYQSCYERQSGCFCKPGYVRDESNTCVEGDSYCGNCTENEYYTAYGSSCQRECKTLLESCDIVSKVTPSGCYCKIGYALDNGGKCIPISECPSKIYLKYLFCHVNET